MTPAMIRGAWASSVLILFLLGTGKAEAHEVRPGYLELRETGDSVFDVLWKVPTRSGRRLALRAELPEGCEVVVPPATYTLVDSIVDRWTVRCPGGLSGRTVHIAGLARTRTDVLVRIEWLDGRAHVERLTPDAPGFEVAATPSSFRTARAYLELGLEHILLGFDHLLFVLALMILVEGRGRLIGAVTAFTVAHSLTLGAATLGFVHVSQQPVEAVIALSIVFLAVEVSHDRLGRPGITKRAPWIAAFAFGLLHGFGFAGALTEVGLPQQAIPVALLFFNVGVEVGQLLFIALALLPLAMTARWARTRRSWYAQVPAYGIGTMAMYWLIERVTGFF